MRGLPQRGQTITRRPFLRVRRGSLVDFNLVFAIALLDQQTLKLVAVIALENDSVVLYSTTARELAFKGGGELTDVVFPLSGKAFDYRNGLAIASGFKANA